MQFLKEYKPTQYYQLVLQGKLYTYLENFNTQAQKRLEVPIGQMIRIEGVDEYIKAQDQVEWFRRMNNIRQRAEENIVDELIFK